VHFIFLYATPWTVQHTLLLQQHIFQSWALDLSSTVGGLLVQTVSSSTRPEFQHSWFSIFFSIEAAAAGVLSQTFSQLQWKNHQKPSFPSRSSIQRPIFNREPSEGLFFQPEPPWQFILPAVSPTLHHEHQSRHY
jgi:membrane-anchored protein YejM (alkaline phosphatase superfamily)